METILIGSVEGEKLPMPLIGFGTYLLKGKIAQTSVAHALAVGYRHIDTAESYRNEVQVGRAITASGINRKEIFITSKISPKSMAGGAKSVYLSGKKCISRLQCNYLDLLLLHWPGVFKHKPDSEYHKIARSKAWDGMEKLYKEGLVRAVGVSNFEPRHLMEFENRSIKPAVNQCEWHPLYWRKELLDACLEKGTILEAYGSLGLQSGVKDMLVNPKVVQISKETGKTAAQVLLRWALERGIPVIPKSQTPQRIEENLNIMDFTLTRSQIELLDGINGGKNKKIAWDPANVL